jgi:hypothetical protein
VRGAGAAWSVELGAVSVEVLEEVLGALDVSVVLVEFVVVVLVLAALLFEFVELVSLGVVCVVVALLLYWVWLVVSLCAIATPRAANRAAAAAVAVNCFWNVRMKDPPVIGT